MAFLARALTGLSLAALCIALIGAGLWRLQDAREARESRPARTAVVRAPLVNAEPLRPVTAEPELRVFGEVRSWRTLEVRAPLAGRLTRVSERFRIGQAVEAGYELVVIDPSDAETRRADAFTSLAEADAEVDEAEEAVLAAEMELKAAERQKALRVQALGRQTSLKGKGFATDADLESAELALAAAEQSVLNREQMVITARKRVERAALRAERARNTVDEAERDVGETRVVAPFAGVLTGVEAILGRLVGVNEKLAELVDPGALEVVFRLSNREFARLLDERGQLLRQPLRVTLDLGGRDVTVTGRVDRVDAVVGDGESGRLLVAQLDVDRTTILRPGDFVSVAVREPALAGVADLPATATTESGGLLVIGEDGVLRETEATVVRRIGDRVLVRDVPFGERIVRERLPQLAAGVRVQVADGGTAAVAAAGNPTPDVIELDPARREALIAAVNAATRLPAERRERILELLSRPKVPRRVVERIEARMQGSGS